MTEMDLPRQKFRSENEDIKYPPKVRFHTFGKPCITNILSVVFWRIVVESSTSMEKAEGFDSTCRKTELAVEPVLDLAEECATLLKVQGNILRTDRVDEDNDCLYVAWKILMVAWTWMFLAGLRNVIRVPFLPC